MKMFVKNEFKKDCSKKHEKLQIGEEYMIESSLDDQARDNFLSIFFEANHPYSIKS